MQHLRRFDGVGIDDNGFAVADFPKEGEAKRQFVQMNTMTGFATTFPAEEDVYHHESGRYLFDSVPKKKDEWRKNVTWKVRDMRTNKVLWTRDFPNGLPVAFATDDVDSLIFAYDVNDSAGKMELQNNPELRARVQALKTQQHAYGIESVDIRTGKINGIMALDTGKGSFKLRDAFRSGDYIVTSDSNDRVQVFAFDGTRKARLQSHGAAGTRDGSLIAATVGRGKLAIYNLKTAKLLCVQQFSSRIAMFQFSAQADRLLVVTRDQKAYYFDTKMLLAAQVASK